ncbi:TRIC cation channel family protein [Streptomyces sp. NPDC090021]|uniref:TRIC cation channel family protein n=1 Tax=Streptomyces sp. NPDC090021 TaxID=3365919 RepID=UPI00380DF273
MPARRGAPPSRTAVPRPRPAPRSYFRPGCRVLTGVTGEVVRDVLCGEFPPLLLREEVYATAALAGAAAYLGLRGAGAPDPAAITVAAGLVLALRLAAIFRDLHLPRLRRVPG